MRVMWAAAPSTVSSTGGAIRIGDPFDLLNILEPPLGEFTRWNDAAASSALTIRIIPPTTAEIDVAGFVVALRFPSVVLGASDVAIYNITFTPEGAGASTITDSVERGDVAISGASPFIDVTTQTVALGTTGEIELTNNAGDFFNDWIVCSFLTASAARSSIQTMKVEISCNVSAVQVEHQVDVGYIAAMRHWDAPNLDNTRSFTVEPKDPSIREFSDGGELFATKINKRRSVGFDFVPSDEATVVKTATPQSSGIMTLADQIGTTQPSMWIPDQDRALAPTMNILGTVQQWQPLQFTGNNRWSMNGLIVDELV